MRASFRFIRIRGIVIGAHWSVPLVTVVLVWSLADTWFPSAYPDLGGSTYLAMGIATAVLYVGCLLLHESGHAVHARQEDIDVREITLWLLGGRTHLQRLPASAAAEFRVAIAGPVISAGLAALFLCLTAVGHTLSLPDPLIGVVDWLARINLLVLLFNLLPVLPLDGGRALRSWHRHRHHDLLAADLRAARAGQAFGLTLIGLGLLASVTGSAIDGVWLVLLGWFLSHGARDEAKAAQQLGVRVGDIMDPQVATVRPGMTIRRFLERTADGEHPAFPVAEDRRLRGLISIRQAAEVPEGERNVRRVADVMLPRDDVVAVRPREDVRAALPAFGREPECAVVTSDDHVVGVLTAGDVSRALAERRVRRPSSAGRSAQHTGAIPIAMIVITTVGVAALAYHPPYVVLSPGPTFNVANDVRIDGRPITPVNGEYLATTVRVSQPHLAQTVIAFARPDRKVMRLSAVLPRGVSPHDNARRQQAMYEESRQIAAAAAAQAAGLPATFQGTGVRVGGTVRDTPASELLREGDVIVGVNGRRIGTMPELRDIVSAGPPGTQYTLTVERDGTHRQVTVRSVELPHTTLGAGLGILGETRGLRVGLPFQIRFTERGDVGGPSAGLAYALAIADLLHRDDYASGRTIAATGTIDITGSVGPVGGITQKTVAADHAGADLFVVPATEVGETRGLDDVPIRGTQNLEQALDLIAAA